MDRWRDVGPPSPRWGLWRCQMAVYRGLKPTAVCLCRFAPSGRFLPFCIRDDRHRSRRGPCRLSDGLYRGAMVRFVLTMERVSVRMVAVALVGRLSESRPQSRCGSTYLSREATKACSLWFQPQVIALNQFEVAKRRRFLFFERSKPGYYRPSLPGLRPISM